MRQIRGGRLWLVLAVLGVAATPASAQSRATAADLEGTVRDDSGALLPGAAVTATNVETSVARGTASDSQGRYLLPALPPGVYTVTAELFGFSSRTRESVTLLPDQAVLVDFSLGLSGKSVTATASENAALRMPSGAAADVAVVKSGPVAGWKPALDALHAALPGQTIREYDLSDRRAEADRLAMALKGHATVVVAFGALAAEALHQRLPDVPLVYCMVNDPGEIGLYDAANTTGVTSFAPVRNQLVAFRAVNPDAKRIGIVVSSETGKRYAEEARRTASSLGLDIVVVAVTSVTQAPQATREMLSGKEAVDALWMLPDPIVADRETRRLMISTTLEAGKPVYGFSAAQVAEGALLSHGPDLTSVGQSAGELVARILGGQKADRLPLGVPRGEVVINQRVADGLGVALAPAVVQAAKLF